MPSTRRRRAERAAVGNDSYRGFVRRIVRAYGRRVASGDIAALPELVALRDELDAEILATIALLRTEEGGAYSWARIAGVLGMTRQAAQKRWRAADSVAAPARRAGGQPSHLR